ncbi:uncharacterized protein LOC62_01G000025 [Vanrija pseudolonga]|uniref:Transmembrane protein n=1 Tax=Vanrija pseudolonga TaxID=143232 RepID=A0AAF0XZ35_9TREE|nr:hypothetical protein LOC62_01G000025 [Vanrija pseudolonga]WOO76403.1 hypothetical protein LOC62_01G000025 [Vanrija pseudolonga]
MRAGSLVFAACVVLAAGISAAPTGLPSTAAGVDSLVAEPVARQIQQHSDPADSTAPTPTTAAESNPSDSTAADATDTTDPTDASTPFPSSTKKPPEPQHQRVISYGMAILALGAVILFYSAIWLTAWRSKVVRARRRGQKPERLRDWVRREMCIGGEGCIIGPPRRQAPDEHDYELLGREQVAPPRAPKDLGL